MGSGEPASNSRPKRTMAFLRTLAIVSALCGAVVTIVARCSSTPPPEPLGQQSPALVVTDGGCDFPLDASMDIYPIDAANVNLNTDTVLNKSFVHWVEQRSVSQTALVKSQIAAGASPSTVSALNSQLNVSTYPITDLTYGTILLSVIGQAHAESSVSPLNSFIWLATPTMTCSIGDGGLPDGDYETSIDCDEALRVRATEMLAYVEAQNPLPGVPFLYYTLNIAKTHSNSAVRQAAIDAYMYESGDTSDASAYLASQIDASDTIFIGRPRMFTDYDASAFDDQLSSWYDAHMDQVPINDAGSDVVLTTVNCNMDGGW